MKYDGRNVYFDKKGYPLVWINGKDKKVHILEWEKYNGKKPEGMQIHHKDNDKSNWNICNLVLVTQSDHFRIHAGWERQGNVWIKKPCKDCKQLLPLDNFYQRKGLTPSHMCIECTKKYYKNKLINDPEHREKKRLYLKDYYKKNKEEILRKEKEKRRELKLKN
ncbi:MAG: HNH endonuclease signature motif containing protein [Candidatus Thorarchaeota archaeon]